jgi:hypothetical protein
MTTEQEIIRLPTTCCRYERGKQCTEAARWSVGVLLWARGAQKSSHSPASVDLPLSCCDYHRLHPPSMDTFFPPAARAMIDAQFQKNGKALPDYDNAEWNFQEIVRVQ